MFLSRLGIRSALAFSIFLGAQSCRATTISFEGLPDGTSVGQTYSSSGVTFTNATVLTSGVSLNELEFPPHGGQNVATDDGGPVTLIFLNAVLDFSAYFTYAEAIRLTAFDSHGNAVSTASSLFSQNYTSSGNSPNELISLAFAGGIGSIFIAGDPSGGSFVMDDLNYRFGPSTNPLTPAPEPATLWLLGTGAFAGLLLRRSATVY